MEKDIDRKTLEKLSKALDEDEAAYVLRSPGVSKGSGYAGQFERPIEKNMREFRKTPPYYSPEPMVSDVSFPTEPEQELTLSSVLEKSHHVREHLSHIEEGLRSVINRFCGESYLDDKSIENDKEPVTSNMLGLIDDVILRQNSSALAILDMLHVIENKL